MALKLQPWFSTIFKGERRGSLTFSGFVNMHDGHGSGYASEAATPKSLCREVEVAAVGARQEQDLVVAVGVLADDAELFHKLHRDVSE